jgi:hypothetical protein
MRLRFLLLMPLAMVFAGAVPATAQEYPPPYGYAQSGYDTDGQSVDSIDVFFEPLARYGRWVDSRFGRAWTPNVGRDWRPYTIGHWEQGAYGQTWRSDEPFGWAVFHFGRWGFDPAIGWVWTPDTVWGPGWVAWRDSDDVAGWAPLPPRVSLSLSFGGAYGDGFNNWGYDQWYQPSWVYVPRGYLYGRSLRGAILPYGRNREYWDGTRGITRYERAEGGVVNRSFDGDGRDRRDRRDDRGRGDPREQRGDAVIQGGGRRLDVPAQGAIGSDYRGASGAPRRERRPDGYAPQAAPPRDTGRGFQQPQGFVPFQPQGNRDPGRRAPPPLAIAPTGGAAVARPQVMAPMPQPRPEAPRAAPPPPRPAPPRSSPQQEVGERHRPE